MQGVEKKMRMQLHLQSSQLCLRQLRFERRLLEFARAQILIIKNGVCRDHNERSDDQIDVETESKIGAVKIHHRRESQSHPRRNQPQNSKVKDLVNGGENVDRDKVNHQVPERALSEFDTEAAAEPKNEQGKRAPKVK